MKREIKKAMLQTAFAILGIYAANCYAGNDYTVKTVNGRAYCAYERQTHQGENVLHKRYGI